MSNRSETTKLIRELKREGFQVTRTGSGHWMVRPPEGPGAVVIAFSPAKRGLDQTMHRLRSIGFTR